MWSGEAGYDRWVFGAQPETNLEQARWQCDGSGLETRSCGARKQNGTGRIRKQEREPTSKKEEGPMMDRPQTTQERDAECLLKEKATGVQGVKAALKGVV